MQVSRAEFLTLAAERFDAFAQKRTRAAQCDENHDITRLRPSRFNDLVRRYGRPRRSTA